MNLEEFHNSDFIGLAVFDQKRLVKIKLLKTKIANLSYI